MIDIRIIDGGRGTYLRAGPTTTGDALVAENRRFFGEETEAFAECLYWYSDYTGSDVSQMQAAHMEQLAEVALGAARANPGLVVAILADADFVYGMARMWSALAEATGWEVGVFRSRVECTSWLEQHVDGGVDVPPG